MLPSSDDEIDAFGLEDFSADFLEELDRAEEAFPSRHVPFSSFYVSFDRVLFIQFLFHASEFR
jgi:hypothetical protein